MKKFEDIPTGHTFGFRGDIWKKVEPFNNGSGGEANAHIADVPNPSRLRGEQMATVDPITLVTEIEQ